MYGSGGNAGYGPIAQAMERFATAKWGVDHGQRALAMQNSELDIEAKEIANRTAKRASTRGNRLALAESLYDDKGEATPYSVFQRNYDGDGEAAAKAYRRYAFRNREHFDDAGLLDIINMAGAPTTGSTAISEAMMGRNNQRKIEYAEAAAAAQKQATEVERHYLTILNDENADPRLKHDAHAKLGARNRYKGEVSTGADGGQFTHNPNDPFAVKEPVLQMGENPDGTNALVQAFTQSVGKEPKNIEEMRALSKILNIPVEQLVAQDMVQGAEKDEVAEFTLLDDDTYLTATADEKFRDKIARVAAGLPPRELAASEQANTPTAPQAPSSAFRGAMGPDAARPTSPFGRIKRPTPPGFEVIQ